MIEAPENGRKATFFAKSFSQPCIRQPYDHRTVSSKSLRNCKNNRVRMDGRSRLYLTTAFICGVLITLGFKDLYPDLERRFRRRRRPPVDAITGAGLSIDDHVNLEDHTKGFTKEKVHGVDIPEGIEACVGNTPLFKIKSLSDATGCEILAKAEVELRKYKRLGFKLSSDP